MKFSGSPQLDTWKCPTKVWLKNSPKFVTSHPILIAMRQFNKNTVCNNKALGISGVIKPFVLYKQTQFKLRFTATSWQMLRLQKLIS